MANTIVVIPARGGSTRIPRKNLQDLCGRPLLAWAIAAASRIVPLSSVYVSTDDDEIANVASLHGAQVVRRTSYLASDHASVLEVAAHVAASLSLPGDTTVLTIQPTTPLIRPETYLDALNDFRSWGAPETLVAVAPSPHRHFRGNLLLDNVLTGAGFYISPASTLCDPGPLSLTYRTFVIPSSEYLDIDTQADLHAARLHLRRAHIVFRVTANTAVGSGHLHRTLALASALSHHDISFHPVRCDHWALELIAARGFRIASAADTAPIAAPTSLLINDTLDTTLEEILPYLAFNYRVITLEDFGPGSDHADLVIQELYSDPRPHALCGPQYAVLRPEFLALPPRTPPSPTASSRILVTFGGTDPANLTARVSRALGSHFPAARIVAPPASSLDPDDLFPGHEPVFAPSMARELLAADIAITSAGRTVNEAAACGTPVISIAANAREATHVYAPGVISLGLHAAITDAQIREAALRLAADLPLQTEISERLRASVDGRGTRRIVRLAEDLIEGTR